jgi:futalosine hydrolase
MGKRGLIMTAVEAEKEAVLRGLRGNDRFDVALAGVGPALAAVRTTLALSRTSYSWVISVGIGGGYSELADIGSIVVANEIASVELGAETADAGFIGLEELGFGTSRFSVDKLLYERVTEAIRAAGLAVRSAPILTVSTATGTAETATIRANRVVGAAAEGMEGYGVAAAADALGVPVLEIRAISNPIGPRDRSAWRIGDALRALEAASSILPEVLA